MVEFEKSHDSQENDQVQELRVEEYLASNSQQQIMYYGKEFKGFQISKVHKGPVSDFIISSEVPPEIKDLVSKIASVEEVEKLKRRIIAERQKFLEADRTYTNKKKHDILSSISGGKY